MDDAQDDGVLIDDHPSGLEIDGWNPINGPRHRQRDRATVGASEYDRCESRLEARTVYGKHSISPNEHSFWHGLKLADTAIQERSQASGEADRQHSS